MLNQIEIIGKIATKPEIGQTFKDGHYYLADIEVYRESGAVDKLPLKIPHNATLELIPELEGKTVSIIGEIRTYNEFSVDKKGKLIIQVFVKSLEIVPANSSHKNEVTVEGFICKSPTVRVTPKGREIADLMIANQRAYNKSSYIPCITWGRNANYVQLMSVGDLVTAVGRLQSRVYQKVIDGVSEDRVAYEVSVQYIETIVSQEEL